MRLCAKLRSVPVDWRTTGRVSCQRSVAASLLISSKLHRSKAVQMTERLPAFLTPVPEALAGALPRPTL
jgi:hypothetical protein